MGGDGIDLSGSTGGNFSFGDVDITDLGAGTGLNLAGGDATLTMSSLDVTGTGTAGSRGIDISGTQNGRTITITNGGNISAVATGVVLGTNGAAGAAPSANFTFGGGSISGSTYALDGIGVNAGDGTYAFGSTAFTGGFNFAVSLSNNYYVAATATGTGDGSSTDNRASIATAIAMASTLGTVNFVLINDGSTIDTGGLTFTLDDGQTVDTFGGGRSFTESGFIIPANITGTNLPAPGTSVSDPTGFGAATLTNTGGGGATLALANGNAIRNIIIGSSAGNAVSGSGIAGVTISGVTSTAGIDLTSTTGAVTLTNLAISNTSGSALSLAGIAGTVTGTNVDITGVNSLAVSGGNGAISFDAGSSVINSSGAAVAITGRVGGSFSHFGSISSNGGTASGITISGAIGANSVTFGGQVSLGTTTALTSVGVSVDNGGTASTVAFDGGLQVVTSTAAALVGTGGGTLRISDAGTETLSTTDAMALSLSGMAVDITLDEVNAINANMTSVLLQNLDGSFAVNGGALSTVASGSSFNSFNVIQNDAGATRALSLAVDNLTIIHEASGATSLPSEHGIVVTTSGDDSAVVAISNSTFQTEDSGVRIIGNNGLITVTDFANNTLLGSATAFDPNLFANGVNFQGVTFDSDLSTAGLQAVNGGTFTAGAPGLAVNHGIFFDSTAGANIGRIDFTNYNVNAVNQALSLGSGNPGLTVGIADGEVTAGQIRLGTGFGVANGDITLSSLTINNQLFANQFAGSFTVTGTTTINAPETAATSGGFFVRTPTTGISVTNSAGAFNFNTLTVASAPGANTTTGGATVGINLADNSGTFTVTGTTTISDTVEDAIRITNTSGAISFGRTVISNPHATPLPAGTPFPVIEARSAAIDISGTITGDISFDELDITLNSPESTGVELTGATINATVSADTFTVSGNGSTGTVAVDLRGALGGGTVRLGDSAAGGSSSSISGVHTGVFLNSATNLDFTYGDGEDAVDTGSTISATVAIDAGSAPVAGTYNFRDVAFSTSPGNGFSLGRIYFVDSDGAVGGGDGSGSDASNPMTLAAAEAAIAAGDIIVLIDNGSVITAAGSNANDTLNLLDNVQLLSFGDGAGGSQALAVNITAPPTILLSAAGINIADPTGNGAATLTTTAGNNVVTLGSTGNRLSGLILEGNGTATRGIYGAGSTSNTVIERSLVRNFDFYSVDIATSANTTIDGVTFSGNLGDLFLGGSNATLRNITATGGSGLGVNAPIHLMNLTGTTTLENISLTSGAGGLRFSTAGGTINATNVDIAGSISGAAIEISGSSTGNFNFDATSSINITSGNVLSMNDMSGGSFTHAGTVVANGTSTSGITSANANGAYSVSFTGTVDLGSTTSIGGSGLFINNNGQAGTFNFANLVLNVDGAAGIVLQGGGSLGIASGSINVEDGVALNLAGTGIAASGINLSSITNTNSGGVGIGLTSVSGGALTVSGTTTISGTSSSAISLATTSSNISLGAVDLTLASGNGLLLDNNSGTLTTGDMTIAMGTGGNGIRATGTNGAMTFGNVDITGVGASATGLNLSGGTFDGEITFATLDITGTGQAGSRGIDLTDYTNSQDVVTTGSGTIQGVQFGVDLTNANIADGVRFQYGDGSAPVASTIDTSAVAGNIAIVTTGLSATGEYDFEDVGFATSNIANLQGANFFVVDTNGTSGTGTFSDPGTIAQAQASGADVIVLVDATTGGVREIVDLGGSSFNLATGQALLGMAGGDSVDVTTLGVSAGGVPASLLLSGISSSSVITAPGTFDTVVPILTSSSGSGTVVLAGTATIQNVFITNSGTGSGISANFGTASTATIRSSTIGSGTGAYAVDISTTSGSSSAALSNLTLTGGLRLDGSAGGLLRTSVTGTNTITSSQTAALTLDTVVTDVGGITFNQITSTGDTAGMSLDGVSGIGSVIVQNATFNRSGTTTDDVVSLNNLTMTGPLTIANLDIDSTNTQSFAGVRATGTSTSTINIGTGANGVTIDDTQFGLIFNGSQGTVNVGTAGAGMQIASRSTAITFDSNSTGTFNIGHAGATSAIAVNAGAALARGIESFNSDATITVTNIDINGTGTNGSSNGIHILDNDTVGSFTLAGTNTIDATGGHGVFIQNANASISGLTLGASATGAGDDISGDGIRINQTTAISNTVTLSDIVMGSGGNGDTGDIAGIGIRIASGSTGALTLNLTGTNTIRSTGQALDIQEVGAGAVNNLLLSIDNTTFESAASGVPTVQIIGQNVSTTESSIGIRSFSGNTVIGNGTGGGILFQAVDFDSDGAGGAVAGGTLDVGQGTGNRVAGDGVSFIDTTGELGFTTLNIFNNGGTGLEVDTKTNGLNTVFTLNGGGSGTVDTTGGTALFLDPLTMNLTFGTVNSTNAAGSGVYVEGGNATAAGNNALTIGTLNVTGASTAGLLITNSVGTFTFGNTVINNAGTTAGGIDIDVTNGDTLNVNFTGNLDIDTASGTGLDVQSSGGSTVTMQTAAAGTASINTTTGRIINAENLLAGAGGINFDTLAASGTVTGTAVSLDLDAGAFSGGSFSVAGTTGGHGALVSGNGGSISFDSATISNVASGASGIVDQHLGSVTFTTVDISNSETGVFTTGIGTLNILGGTISVTGLDGNDRGVWIGGGNGTTNIAADITQNGVGQAVYVHNVFGGTTTFSGDITFSGGGANGITAENNTGGTVTFSGLTTLATGANTAVQLIDNTGSTINFTGGLDIDTTSGTGFSATGGGTVSVSGGTRTINTATGRGIVMNSVAVGASDVFFNTVAVSGLSSGNFIDLQNVSGGTFRVADTSVFDVNGTGVRIANSSADFIFNGLTLGNTGTPGSMTYGIDLDGNSGSFTTTASSIIYYAQDAGIRITNAQSTFLADFQAQMEVSNRNDPTYTAGGGGLLLQNNNAASQTTFTRFVHTDFQRNTGGGTTTANGQGINADSGGILTILGGSVTTNNALGAGVASIDIRNTTTNVTLNSVSLDNDDLGESGGGIYLENNTGSFTLEAASNYSTSNSIGLYANNAGTVTLGNVSAFNITSFGGGRALDIRNTAMNITLGTINNPGSSGSPIRLSDGTSGSLTVGNMTVSNAAGTGPTILISDLAAGSSVTFGGSAAVTSGANTAVSLANNAGSTINFSNGGLVINTTSGTGFLATGGGTVTVTGTGNTVDTGTGTAVQFVNTQFGAAGVTFQSINTNGAVNGIVLDSTGNTGGFAVTGSGSTLGSGGTIQNSTGSGIMLTNTYNVALTNLDITTTGVHGIFGSIVTNLDLTRVRITDAGNAADENGIFLQNLRGTAAEGLDSRFDSVTITGAADAGIDIANSTATASGDTSNPDLLTIVNSTISNSGVLGLLAQTSDTAGNLRIDMSGSTLTNNASRGVAANASNGNLQLNLTGGNQLVPGGGGTQFVGVAGTATGNGQLFFNITGNTITQAGTAGTGPAIIALNANDTGRLQGTISGNTLTTTTAAGTPIDGIVVTNSGSGNNAVTIQNNNITINDGFGIFASGRDAGTGRLDVQVLNNTINVNGTDIANTGIDLRNQGTVGQTVCFQVQNNTISTAPAGNGDIVIENSASGTFLIQGLGGTFNEAADFNPDTQTVEIFLTGQQSSVTTGSFINPFSASTTFGTGTCNTPTAP